MANANNNAAKTSKTAPHGWLLRYSDATYIRPATAAERRASICAGAEGVIEVVIDGERVACYVEE